MAKRTNKVTVTFTDEEKEKLSEIARNSYSVYLATVLYRVAMDILNGKIKIN